MKYWYLWIFPAAALVICGILVMRSFDHGPKIEIAFPDAEGIMPGRTPVKYKGIPVGTVDNVRLEGNGVIAEIELEEPYAQFAVEGSKFYLVEPAITLNGVSGLSTLRDGNYIAVQPGSGEPNHKFVATMGVQQVESEAGHIFYYLRTADLGSMSIGDPLYFRGLSIGQIFSVSLTPDATAALIRVGVKRQYTKLIRASTVFWKKHAIDADLGLFKSEIKVGSLESLFKGGIDLAVNDMKAPRAKVGALFELFEKKPEIKPKKQPDDLGEPAQEIRATSM